MNAASLRSVLLMARPRLRSAGGSEAQRRHGISHAVQGAAILVLATSVTLPIVTRPARLTLGADLAIRSADRLGRHCVLVHLSHRPPGYRITHGVPDVRAHAPEWTELLPLGRLLA
jgi:hypothetical protein